jgi:hypothetical protein
MDRESRENQFCNNYLAVLVEHEIKDSHHTWYVSYCEAFIRPNKDAKLKQHTSSTASAYLSIPINAENLAAWQKKQVIDALSLLFKCIHAPLYREIDWDYWKVSCRYLGKNHDTHYHSTHPVEYKPSAPVIDASSDTSPLLTKDF